MECTASNSSPPSAVYIRKCIGLVLVQITGCRLFGAKPLSKPILSYCIVDWTLRNKYQWNCFQNTKFFIHKKASENIVCEMPAILSRGRWVKWYSPPTFTSTCASSWDSNVQYINLSHNMHTVLQFFCWFWWSSESTHTPQVCSSGRTTIAHLPDINPGKLL